MVPNDSVNGAGIGSANSVVFIAGALFAKGVMESQANEVLPR
jgi:hypothetical protein